MPKPAASDVHVDAALTGLSVAYIQDRMNFAAPQIFPMVPVQKQSDKYFKFDKADWFRDEAKRRGDSEESAGGGFSLSTDSYFCDVWAFHKDVGHISRANQDPAVDLEESAARYVTQVLMQRQEQQFMSDYIATSVWDNDVTPSPTWDDATSDPIGDVETGKGTILQNTGFEPNVLGLGYDVFRQLKHHPDIVDRVKHTSAQSITADTLATVFDIERVVVMKSVKNTANEGASSPTMAFSAGKNALLAFSNPTPGLMEPSAGYIFSWDEVSQGLGESIGITRETVPNRKATRVEGEIAFDDKVVAKDLGYFFSGAVA